jgi:hypothetical protein
MEDQQQREIEVAKGRVAKELIADQAIELQMMRNLLGTLQNQNDALKKQVEELSILEHDETDV